MPTRKELANAIRFLSIDAIQKAKSGHPGAPMGMADMAEVLWNDFLVHNPADPDWANRDRFVLSNGHASMLLYSLLHLTGYDVSIEDIKNFRQLRSKTPGHPERGYTPGVDMTTGPLGQGIATAVGMALAERILGEQYNREEFPVIDHFTYVFMGDGCLMEGISHEACSLAGTLGLGKLIALWDSNGISIDGKVKGWFAEDTAMRFAAYGWQVIDDVDGHDPAQIKKAIAKARKTLDKPTLICCTTVIAQGAPALAGSEKTHGGPLGDEEIEATRKALSWSYPPFEVPVAIKAEWDARKSGKKAQEKWVKLMQDYAEVHPELHTELARRLAGTLPDGWEAALAKFKTTAQKEGTPQATRLSSKKVLDVMAPLIPELLGGSADLASSVCTLWDGAKTLTPQDFSGRHISYGVREFAMSTIMNGLALHGGFIPYGGTFLVFSDYLKPAVRLAALMKIRSIWVLTHDSIMVGEDGPTHQPVEHLAALRLTPNVHVWRPADTVETAAAWAAAVQRTDGPSCLALSRQNLPILPREARTVAAIDRGGYCIKSTKGQPDILLIASGSEVTLALQAAEILEKREIKTQVVSMPCPELFDQQDREWRESVLPYAVRARVAIEAATGTYWRKYVGLDGTVVGMESFGESAPGPVVYQHFGFTVDLVVAAAKESLRACKPEEV